MKRRNHTVASRLHDVNSQDEEIRYADPWAELAANREDRKRRQADGRAFAAKFRRPGEPARKNLVPPKVVKPAAFYVSPKIKPTWFPTDLHLWVARYFVNLVRWRYIHWRANGDGYSQLAYALLDKVLTSAHRKTYAEARAVLQRHGVIECDRTAVVGSKAYGFRLTEDYRDTRRVVCTDDWLNRRIAAVYAREQVCWLPVHHWLRDMFDLLNRNDDKARRIVGKIKPERTSKLTTAEYRKQRADNWAMFANRDDWFVLDKVGRFHTPLTSLEEELRCCLTVGGEPLIGIDLACSQPLILGLFALHYLRADKSTRSRINNRQFKEDVKDPYHAVLQGFHKLHATHNPTTHKPPHTHVSTSSVKGFANADTSRTYAIRDPQPLPRDLNDYLEACLKGEFYESLMTPEQLAKGKDYRKRFKQRFFVVLFGERRTKGRFRNDMKRRFRQTYPTVAGVLYDLKRKDYRHSSALLQNWEAAFFIGIVCRRIMKERPALPLFTIHDSLLTTPAHADYVEAVVRDEFAKIGVNPTLKRELYD